jgi:hypothetical protein
MTIDVTMLLAAGSAHSSAIGTVILAVIGCIGLILVLLPSFRRGITAPLRNDRNDPQGPAMSRRGLLVAYLAVVPILGGSTIAICRDSEHWPWSCYPMYSNPDSGRHFDDYRLYGVPADFPSSEIPLANDSRYIRPFDNFRLAGALFKAVGKPRLHGELVDLLMRYEQMRREGRHGGPELITIRLYHVFWTLDPWGRNLDSPDRKELIDEAESPANPKLK